MSINTDPDLYDYSPPIDNCNTCFVVNETSEQLLFFIGGIQVGNLWAAPDPPPPNGIILIENIGGCTWFLDDGVYDYMWTNLIFDFNCTIATVGGDPIFNGNPTAPCTYGHTNAFAVPAGNKYFDGFVQLLPTKIGGEDSLPAVMALLSDDPVWAKYANPQPIDEVQTVHKFYDPRDRTNIKILYEGS